MNIMDMVKKSVSDQVMGQIGGMLGMSDPKKTSSTFDTAIGSILGGLMKKSSSQEGAKQVFDMASKSDAGIMDKLGDILGGGGDQLEAVQKTGGGMLEGILGGSQQSSGMIGTIAKALGLDGSIVGKLLTLAAPMLLGVIGKHIKSAGMDALGLSSLLGEQKQHLSAAMPSGLSQNLGFGNLLSGVGDLGNSAVNAAGNAASSVTNAASNAAGNAASSVTNAASSVTNAASNTANSAANAAGDVAKKGGGLLTFLLPLIVLGAIGYFAWPYIMGAANQAKEGVENVAAKTGDLASGAFDFGGVDVSALGDAGPKLQEGFSGITSGFTGLAETGEDGANALATKITDFSGSIGDMGLGDLSDTAKPVATSMIGKFVEAIKGMLGSQNDTIKGILEGPVNTLLEKLTSFGQ